MKMKPAVDPRMAFAYAIKTSIGQRLSAFDLGCDIHWPKLGKSGHKR